MDNVLTEFPGSPRGRCHVRCRVLIWLQQRRLGISVGARHTTTISSRFGRRANVTCLSAAAFSSRSASEVSRRAPRRAASRLSLCRVVRCVVRPRRAQQRTWTCETERSKRDVMYCERGNRFPVSLRKVPPPPRCRCISSLELLSVPLPSSPSLSVCSHVGE